MAVNKKYQNGKLAPLKGVDSGMGKKKKSESSSEDKSDNSKKHTRKAFAMQSSHASNGAIANKVDIQRRIPVHDAENSEIHIGYDPYSSLNSQPITNGVDASKASLFRQGQYKDRKQNGITKYSHGGLISPNGNRSNLEYKYWNFVRTIPFLLNFGNWIKEYNVQRLMESSPMPINYNWHMDRINDQRGVFDYLVHFQGGMVNHPYFEEPINISNIGFKHTLWRDKEGLYKYILHRIQDIIANSIYIESEENEHEEQRKDAPYFHYLFCKIQYEGTLYWTYVDVKQTIRPRNKYVFYDLTVLPIDESINEKELIAEGRLYTPYATISSFPKHKDKKINRIFQNKSSDLISYKLDANNEPNIHHVLDFNKSFNIRLQKGGIANSKNNKNMAQSNNLPKPAAEVGGYLVSKENGKTVVHENGDKGGLLVGQRHSEGGIKMDNTSTNQKLEAETGELLLTNKIANNDKTYELDGKELSAKEVASNLNVQGGGIRFSAGGAVVDKREGSPVRVGGGAVVITRGTVLSDKTHSLNGKSGLTAVQVLSQINQDSGGNPFDLEALGENEEVEIKTSNKKYEYGGKMMSDVDIVSSCGCKHSQNTMESAGGIDEKTKEKVVSEYRKQKGKWNSVGDAIWYTGRKVGVDSDKAYKILIDSGDIVWEKGKHLVDVAKTEMAEGGEAGVGIEKNTKVHLKNAPEMVGTVGFISEIGVYVKFSDGSDGIFEKKDLVSDEWKFEEGGITEPEIQQTEQGITEAADTEIAQIQAEIKPIQEKINTLEDAFFSYGKFKDVKAKVISWLNKISVKRFEVPRREAMRAQNEERQALVRRLENDPEQLMRELNEFNAIRYDVAADIDKKYSGTNYEAAGDETIFDDTKRYGDILEALTPVDAVVYGDIYEKRYDILADFVLFRKEYQGIERIEERVLEPLKLSFSTLQYEIDNLKDKEEKLNEKIDAIEAEKSRGITQLQTEAQERQSVSDFIDGERAAIKAAEHEKSMQVLSSPLDLDIPEREELLDSSLDAKLREMELENKLQKHIMGV